MMISIKIKEIDNINYNIYAYEGHVAINLNSDSSELTEKKHFFKRCNITRKNNNGRSY